MSLQPLLKTLLISASCLSLSVLAQSAPPPSASSAPQAIEKGERGMGQHHRHGKKARHDCTQAKNPTQCQARQDAMKANHDKAKQACQEKTGKERQNCMRLHMLNMTDCSQSVHRERCEARKAAASKCQNQTGEAFQICMKKQMPPPDCSQARHPERCQKMQAARAACQQKPETERRACMREQLPPKPAQ